MLPVTVAEALHSHHSRSVTLHNHSAHRAAVAGIAVVYRYPASNRAAADYDFC
jgi:hypothetical protein